MTLPVGLPLRSHFSDLVGDKITLSIFNVEDITHDYVGWLNDLVVVRFSNQRFYTHTLETCTNFISNFINSPNLFLKITRKSDGMLLGTMTAYYSAHHRTVDMGIMLGCRTVWGCGIGQDAWDTLLFWLLGLSSVRKVNAGAMRCNIAMVKVIERSAMVLEAIRQEQELLDGVPQDLLYFGKMSGY